MTATSAPTTACLHQLIEARADARPDALAVDAGDRYLTYRELETAGNHLAGRIRMFEPGPHRLVALYGRVCPELLVAMLAVLKAGSAFLPLDPAEPAIRTRRALSAAQPTVLLTTEEWAPQAADLGVPMIVLAADALTAVAERRATVTASHDVAYALSTSGSTGLPRCVLVEHHSIVNYCAWVANANRVGDAVAALPTVTRFTFDASLQQTLAPLTRGDAVWLVPDGVGRDPDRLLALLGARPGVGLHCVPTLWEELLLMVESGRHAPRLASLFLGGEPVRVDLWERTRRVLPDTAMANVYGPTETTVQATGGFQQPGQTLHTGWPVHNVKVYVVDDPRRANQVGVEGEIYLGGAGVARGYLGDPELTATRFVDGAEVGLAADRLFRSGDIGTLLADGAVQVLGRIDDQLKIRGFRIEPGEVEAAVASHPAVRRAAVVAPLHGEHAGALCVAVVGSGVGAEELRLHTAALLPAYMVPAHWEFVDVLPVRGNGKIDRRQVAANLRGPGEDGRPLSGTDELTVARIWREVLGTEVNSADTDFFDAGGNSLNATRVAARLRRVYGTKDALRVLFDDRTVGAVAASLALGRRPSPALEDIPLGDGPAPLSVQQQAIWSIEQRMAGTPFNNVLLSVRILGPLDTAALSRAWRQLSDEPALRTRFAVFDDGPMQRLGLPRVDPLAVHDMRHLDPRQRQPQLLALCREVFVPSFDLARGPVARGLIAHLAPRESMLLVCTHHLVCDGVSLQFLLERLVAAYRDEPAPPRSPPPYLEFARLQRRQLASGDFRADLDYWRSKLAAPSPVARDETARRDNPFRFDSVSATMGEALAGRVTAFARQEAATPFMCLATVLAGLLHLRGSVSPVRLGTLAANRDGGAFDGTVGPFATTLVLQLEIPPGATLRQLLRVAREELLQAYRHQRVPLELVMDSLGAELAPPFQVGLAWQPSRTPIVAREVRFEPSPVFAQGEGLAVLPSSTDLSVTVAERGTELHCSVEYRVAVFDRRAAQDFVQALFSLLDRQLAEPDRPLCEFASLAGRPR
jgi:amino acid adenylation domain-containing protein